MRLEYRKEICRRPEPNKYVFAKNEIVKVPPVYSMVFFSRSSGLGLFLSLCQYCRSEDTYSPRLSTKSGNFLGMEQHVQVR